MGLRRLCGRGRRASVLRSRQSGPFDSPFHTLRLNVQSWAEWYTQSHPDKITAEDVEHVKSEGLASVRKIGPR